MIFFIVLVVCITIYNCLELLLNHFEKCDKLRNEEED